MEAHVTPIVHSRAPTQFVRTKSPQSGRWTLTPAVRNAIHVIAEAAEITAFAQYGLRFRPIAKARAGVSS